MKKIRFSNLFACICILGAVLLTAGSASAATVQAVIDLKPDTISLDGHDRWVSVSIELPRPYSVRNIMTGTVVLTVNGNVIRAQSESIHFRDQDRDGTRDMMVEFDCRKLQSHLFLGPQALKVSGSIAGGDTFEGTDTIKGELDKKCLSKLTILQTSDIHNHASGYGPFIDYTPDSLNDDEVLGGFARLGTLIGTIRQAQAKARIPTLLFDSGDYFMGTTYDLTAPDPIIYRFFQAMGYDAVTLGNHEFDWGPGGLALLLGNGVTNGFTVPVIATNAVTSVKDSGDDGIEELESMGVIINKKVYTLNNGLKIGLLGLMGPNADEKAPVASPVTFNHDYAFIQKCVNELRKKYKADVVAVLSHGGVDNDGYGDDADLAQNVSGIDIIASGHYHTATDKAFISGASNSIIFSPGEYGEFLSRLDVTYSQALGRVVGYTFRLLPVDDSVPGAPAVQAMVEQYNAGINASLMSAGLPEIDETISTTNFDLELAPFEVTGLGSLCADAVRNVANAVSPINFPNSPIDISVVPSGTIHGRILAGNTGDITFSDIYNCLPLGISPYQTTPPGYPLMHTYLTGAEVYLMCEIGLTLSHEMDSDYYLNFSGIKIDYDPSKAGSLRGVQAVYLYSYQDPFCIGTPVFINPYDKSRLYHIAVDLYTLEMLNIVNSYLPSGYSIVPKKADGTQLLSTDFINYRIDATPASGVVELKAWMALLNYLPGLGGAVPSSIYGTGGAFSTRVNYVTP
jgi:5'-nucleotidase / UDP-sugar diphosphatase